MKFLQKIIRDGIVSDGDDIKAIMIASLFSGFVLWILVYYKLIYASLVHGRLPFDILFMFLPILLITVCVGTTVGSVIYLILLRLKILNSTSVVLSVLIISFLVSSLLRGMKYSLYDLHTTTSICIAGCLGGVLFSILRNLKLIGKS